jgi:hypothetical protein
VIQVPSKPDDIVNDRPIPPRTLDRCPLRHTDVRTTSRTMGIDAQPDPAKEVTMTTRLVAGTAMAGGR